MGGETWVGVAEGNQGEGGGWVNATKGRWETALVFFWAVFFSGFGELCKKPVFESNRFLNLIQGEVGRQFLRRMGWSPGSGETGPLVGPRI